MINKYSKYTNPNALISAQTAYEWIQQSPTKYKIVDVRSHEDYLQEHVPFAISIPCNNIEKDEATIKSRISPHDIEILLSDLGISNDTHILIIDQNDMMFSARLWWTLLTYGHKNMSIIDGGWTNWKTSNLPTTTDIPKLTKSDYKVDDSGQEQYIAYLEEVKTRNSETILWDARSIEEQQGTVCLEGAVYAGHIEHAIFLPFNELLNDYPYEILPREELERIIDKYELTPDKHIIIYCHAGTRAALVLFILKELLGFTNIKNYNGSWIEYSNSVPQPTP